MYRWESPMAGAGVYAAAGTACTNVEGGFPTLVGGGDGKAGFQELDHSYSGLNTRGSDVPMLQPARTPALHDFITRPD
jgi:hypothetical protein